MFLNLIMEKVVVVSKYLNDLNHLKKVIKKNGFKYSKKPDLVFSFGGDGTYLFAERKYPGIPKVLIKDSVVCNKCGYSFRPSTKITNCESCGNKILNKIDKAVYVKKILKKIKEKKYSLKKYSKLEVVTKNKKLMATNDVILRNKEQIYALRFRVLVNGRNIGDVLIGDGIVVSTPYGSKAYYKSISGKSFGKGIGLAFNNINKKIKNLVLSDKARIKVEILRGDAMLSVDNNKKIIKLVKGEEVLIKKSEQVAKILELR